VYDSHRYPDPAQRAPADSRAAVDGEFGGLGLFVAGHTWASTGWAYEREPTAAQLTRRYAQLLAEVRDLEIHCGLSGAIYTQAYDVEREVDGLQTYDRAVLKVARSQALAANASVLSAANALEPGTCAASGGGRL
jgi:hypothetical protein